MRTLEKQQETDSLQQTLTPQCTFQNHTNTLWFLSEGETEPVEPIVGPPYDWAVLDPARRAESSHAKGRVSVYREAVQS